MSPNKLPNSTPEYLSIESFFMLQAAKDAPPKMAAVKPKQVGTIVGLIAVAIAIRGAELNPRPTIPSPNIAFLRGELTDLIISIFSIAFSFCDSTTYLGFMKDMEMNPPRVATMPPIESGIIIAAKAGIDKTAYEVPKAPKNERPVVVQTSERNLLTPTFFEMTQFVLRLRVYSTYCFQFENKYAGDAGTLSPIIVVLVRLFKTVLNILIVIIMIFIRQHKLAAKSLQKHSRKLQHSQSLKLQILNFITKIQYFIIFVFFISTRLVSFFDFKACIQLSFLNQNNSLLLMEPDLYLRMMLEILLNSFLSSRPGPPISIKLTMELEITLDIRIKKLSNFCVQVEYNKYRYMGKIIENYELKEQLGQGVYAKVYKAVHLVTKQEVAIKVVQAEKFKQIPKLQECTVNEINILSTLQSCPYIVKYIDMLKTANNFYFVYQYCNGGTLDKLMQKEGPFPEKRVLFYFKQIIEAFKILSRSNIMHRDIKPDNILMNNGNIKIADFGFCKPLENPNELAQTMLGSPIYMAPEVIKGEIYTIKADIWSVGVVLYQMVFGKCPFESKSIAKLIKMLEDEEVVIPDYPKISPTLEKLLKRILVKDYNNRIDWKEMFQYTITQTGEIYPPGVSPNSSAQFGLRQSIRNSTGFGAGSLNFSQNASTNANSSMNDSMKNSPILSPKVSKQENPSKQEESRQYLMKKKSPLKAFDDKQPSANINTSINYNQNNLLKNEQYAKNDRSNRFELLLKNHAKCSTLNQMILDMFRLQQSKSIYIAYYLFKSIEKEINGLFESLKKEQPSDSNTQDPFRQFKTAIEKEIDSVKGNLFLIRECIDEDGEYKMNELDNRRAEIIRTYLEGVKLTRQEELILILQIVDYLEESILIKKDAYEKLTKQHLQKQLKYKFSKYNIEKDFN